MLPYSCNSGWSVSPSARWGNSVLCCVLSPMSLAQCSATPLLFLTLPPLSGSLASCPTSPTPFPEVGLAFYPVPSVVDYNSLSMFFSFVGGGYFNLPTICSELCWGRACVMCGGHLLGLQLYASSFETGCWGEMAGSFSQGRCLLGLGSARRGVGRLSMG
jgi:hypothetical protein